MKTEIPFTWHNSVDHGFIYCPYQPLYITPKPTFKQLFKKFAYTYEQEHLQKNYTEKRKRKREKWWKRIKMTPDEEKTWKQMERTLGGEYKGCKLIPYADGTGYAVRPIPKFNKLFRMFLKKKFKNKADNGS